MKILLKLSFVGTEYCGWQSQKNGNSVQENLTLAAEKLFGCRCDITGCSRTDSGVHANCFCAVVNKKGDSGIVTTVPIERIPRALNTFLPDDISVYAASEVDDEFHPRYRVYRKEYIYKIHTRSERDAFLSKRAWHLPKQLDVEAMNTAARYFVGKHDFASFMAQGSKIVDTTRTVYDAAVEKDGDVVTFRVTADGFLYNMVRIMTGTLAEVGEGRIKPAEIETIINSGDRSKAGKTAPAHGLYLNKVIY